MPIVALNTRDVEIIWITLKILHALVSCSDTIGEALVPYYRQILPVLNLFKIRNKNLGDKIDYSQRKAANLGDLIQQTLVRSGFALVGWTHGTTTQDDNFRLRINARLVRDQHARVLAKNVGGVDFPSLQSATSKR